MSTELFMEDVIKPVLYLLAFALIVTAWGMAIVRWWCAGRKEKQQVEQVEANGPVRELAQRMYPCPYRDVHEQANWIAYEAWQKGSKQR